MEKLVFATNNKHKLTEIKSILEPEYKVSGLEEMGIKEDIPEDHETLVENAFQKAHFIFSSLGISCFADDTGLEIDALDGEPGVYSARYSRMGDPVYPEMEVAKGNVRKVLEKLDGQVNRTARFRTVIALILDGKEFAFEGVVEGEIALSPEGEDGFGYDPIFIPEKRNVTFAQMSLEEKNKISHRARAVAGLVDFLKNYKSEAI